MAVGERLLRIIERVGILFALTFNSTQNETLYATFNESHISMLYVCTFYCFTTLIFSLFTLPYAQALHCAWYKNFG